MNFFFDTANTEYIKNTWNKLKGFTTPSSVIGITTNPSAFSKLSLLKLDDWLDRTEDLCSLTSSIREDSSGQVFIQFPSSTGSILELEKFINKVKKVQLKIGSSCQIGIKIPPFEKFLNYARINDFISNVTGISDCGTGLKSISYRVNWISLIPGRMEPVGINFEAQLGYLQNVAENSNTGIITGAMRTVDGLIKCIRYGTTPTIGTTVFDLIEKENAYKNVFDAVNHPVDLTNSGFCPLINNVNRELSETFFKQMDECGSQAYEDLKNS